MSRQHRPDVGHAIDDALKLEINALQFITGCRGAVDVVEIARDLATLSKYNRSNWPWGEEADWVAAIDRLVDQGKLQRTSCGDVALTPEEPKVKPAQLKLQGF